MANPHDDDDDSTIVGITPKDNDSVNLLKDDDDESTILESTSKPIPQETPSPASKSSSIVSPATQTLNVLSQNMDDLRYSHNKKSIDLEQSHDEKKVAANPCRLQWKDYQNDWERIPICISDHPGTVGMHVAEASFHTTFGLKHKNRCQIRKSTGLARKLGLQEGDWVCHPMVNENQEFLLLAEKDQVMSWAKQRPFSFCILRCKSTKKTSQSKIIKKNIKEQPWLTSVNHDSQDNETKQLVTSRPRHKQIKKGVRGRILAGIQSQTKEVLKLSKVPVRKSTASSPARSKSKVKASSSASKSSSVVPFCFKCNTPASSRSQPRAHHSWCSLNSFYDNSGAQEIMKRIQYGRENLSCQACQKEYETGKLVPKQSHLEKCNRYRKQLEKYRDREEDNEEQVIAKKEKLQRLAVEKLLSSSSEQGNIDEDMDDVSFYQPTTKKAKIAVLSPGIAKSKPRPNLVPVKPQTAKAVQSVAFNKTPKIAPKNGSRKVTPPKSSTSISSAPPPTPANKRTEEGGHREAIKPVWRNCLDENPWGRPGYMEGDVLLYGPQSGIGHYESTLPNKRYTIEPFAPSSCYLNTHCTPQEGYTMLALRRDPLASCPWGFQVDCDEFGHACLVQSVDPISPASEATFVGAAIDDPPAGLKVNDMILSVNGRLVGGMTEFGVHLEIATSGASLNLVVSRYKHADNAQKKFVEAERHMMHVMDAAARDDRLIGYIEIGNGASVPSLGRDRGKQQSPSNRNSKATEAVEESASLVSPMQEDKGHRLEEDHEEDCPVVDSTTVAHHQVLSQEVESSSKESSDTPSDDDASGSEQWNRDENAWNGCVCGEIHDNRYKKFWIQCESCDSWYDVSGKCVGFTEDEAKNLKTWSCWACPSPRVDDSQAKESKEESSLEEKVKNDYRKVKISQPVVGSCVPVGRVRQEGRMTHDGCVLPRSEPKKKEDGSFLKPCGKCPKGMVWDECRGLWTPKKKAGKSPSLPLSEEKASSGANLRSNHETFKIGDLVSVEPHSWPGMNSQGGIGYVVSIGEDEDGDPCYSVKYAIGGTDKGVEPEFISPHSFD